METILKNHNHDGNQKHNLVGKYKEIIIMMESRKSQNIVTNIISVENHDFEDYSTKSRWRHLE